MRPWPRVIRLGSSGPSGGNPTSFAFTNGEHIARELGGGIVADPTGTARSVVLAAFHNVFDWLAFGTLALPVHALAALRRLSAIS